MPRVLCYNLQLPYLFDCTPQLIKLFCYHFVWLIVKGGLQRRAGYIFYFFVLSKGTDDAHLFLVTFFSPTLFLHSILFRIT